MRLSNLRPDSRISAINVPNTSPPTAESAVSVSVNVMPSRNRYPSERRITSKSKVLNIRRLSLPGDVAGNGDPAFEEAHGGHDDNVDKKIQHRRRREGFEHLERKFLHGAGFAGQFDQSDGNGDRRVLDGREKFRRQRRQDDTKSNGQQYVAIGLHRRQPERGRGHFLPTRQRTDAGTKLFGH